MNHFYFQFNLSFERFKLMKIFSIVASRKKGV